MLHGVDCDCISTSFGCNCSPIVLITSGKSDVCGDEERKNKMKRYVMLLLEKLVVLNEFEWGIGVAVIGHHYGVNR